MPRSSLDDGMPSDLSLAIAVLESKPWVGMPA
jgi:hypothetical protein